MGKASTLLSIIQGKPNEAAYKYWDQLDKSLQPMGDATKELVEVCQNWWWIPLLVSALAVVVWIVFGGMQGRVKAKSFLGILIIGTAVLAGLTGFVAMFLGFFNLDASQLSA